VNDFESRHPTRGIADPNRRRDRLGVGDGMAEHDGAAPAAWNPHILGRALQRSAKWYSVKPRQVRRDVAALPTGIERDVGRLAEHVDDLEGSGLLTFDAVGVDRVDRS